MTQTGYACLNLTTGFRTNRSMKKATFEKHGIEYASQLALENVRDLS